MGDALRRQKDSMDSELRTERLRRQRAEIDVTTLRQETARLKALVAASADDVCRRMARLECEPLRDISLADLPAMRKKLLLKWHPDKQPTPRNASLATQVMQELQNRPEWDPCPLQARGACLDPH